jgi:hypothetical protein
VGRRRADRSATAPRQSNILLLCRELPRPIRGPRGRPAAAGASHLRRMAAVHRRCGAGLRGRHTRRAPRGGGARDGGPVLRRVSVLHRDPGRDPGSVVEHGRAHRRRFDDGLRLQRGGPDRSVLARRCDVLRRLVVDHHSDPYGQLPRASDPLAHRLSSAPVARTPADHGRRRPRRGRADHRRGRDPAGGSGAGPRRGARPDRRGRPSRIDLGRRVPPDR